MTHSIAIYADYVCPYCLLAEKMLSKMIGERGIQLVWHPFELRPAPVPTLRPEDPYLPSIWQQSVYPLAERLSVPIQLPSISPQPRTSKALELLMMAQIYGLDHPYSMRVLQAFFQKDRDIGDPELLFQIAAEIGLDSKKARLALGSGMYAESLREAQHHAQEELHITSVPTIVIGKQIFRGMPSLDELRQSIDRLESQAEGNLSLASPPA